MNHPLRYAGLTFASLFYDEDTTSIFHSAQPWLAIALYQCITHGAGYVLTIWSAFYHPP